MRKESELIERSHGYSPAEKRDLVNRNNARIRTIAKGINLELQR